MRSNKMPYILVLIIGMVIGYSLAALVYPSPSHLELPGYTEEVSECIPGVGKQWIGNSGLHPNPVYLTDRSDVIGIKYEVSEKAAENILSSEIISSQEQFSKYYPLDKIQTKFDHARLDYSPNEENLYEVFLYTIPREKISEICKK